MYYQDESMLDRNYKRLEDNLILLFQYSSPAHISFLNWISVMTHKSAIHGHDELPYYLHIDLAAKGAAQ